MYLDVLRQFEAEAKMGAQGDMVRLAVARPCSWSVIVPFFNERDYLADTLESLAAQSVPFTLILVDNASTDGSAEVATMACRRVGLPFILLTEYRAGKVSALAAGLARVTTRYVATCDADTWYPPHYLAAAQTVLERTGRVIAGAYFYDRAGPTGDAALTWKAAILPRLLHRQSHTGGAGQAFRTDALRTGGGFDPDRWNWVLEDHEIVHRTLRHGGTMGYARNLWCAPAKRGRNRASIRWTLGERLLYAVTAPVAGDWFFYRFLRGRLHRRRLTSERIRERPFQTIDPAAHPVCG